MKMPDNNRSKKKVGGMKPASLRGRWLLFSSFTRMHVNASGGWGPACRPYQHVLQLQIDNRLNGDESWTVYRNNEEPRKDGKVVFRKWDALTDWAKLQKLDGKELTEDWHKDYTVTERQFPVSSRWLTNLHEVLTSISIPPIAGPIGPFSAGPNYKLLLWRNSQESEFSWKQKPPAGWKPLTTFYFSLLEKLREQSADAPVFSPKDIMAKKR